MPVLKAAAVDATLRGGDSARIDADVPPRFAVGQAVRVRNLNPLGHTRAPRYIRGRTGVIDRDHGVFAFPDTNAASGDKTPQHVYSVRFDAAEVWGEGAAPGRGAIYIDLWDDYLDPA